jgi:cytochrome d ubiquinol oxidase subunit I
MMTAQRRHGTPGGALVKVLLSRWQFRVTITYDFLFVPLTIGLALLVAVMQVLAYRRQDQVWDRLARFFGTLFLINFAMGVVTGIVQEFQFGMNWSNYSVFVGNIFGAPLAMEGLVAFFAESTFVGLWIFGRTGFPRWRTRSPSAW